MLEPCQPIDGMRQDRFRPPFCPREDCPDHRFVGDDYPFTRAGSYRRRSEPHRRLQRFRCARCGSTFSRSTFSPNYYSKRRDLLLPVAKLLVSGAAQRQAARFLDCGKTTVTRLAEKIGRHAEWFHAWTDLWIDEIREPIVHDDLESFVGCPPNRIALGTSVGAESWFVYRLYSVRYLGPMNRSHRRPALKRRLEPGRPGGRARAFAKTLKSLASKAAGPLQLITDDHPAYRAAVRQVDAMFPKSEPIQHRIFANPDRSPGYDRKLAAERDRHMFAADLYHKIVRHSQAEHKRETLSFGRKASSVTGRGYHLAVWRNMIKSVSERKSTQMTPAMRIGLTSRPWRWEEVFARRQFPARIALGMR